MTARSTVYQGPHFFLCCGHIPTDQKLPLVYRNLRKPESVNGNVTQWIWVTAHGKMVTEDGIEIDLPSGELIKMPRLHGKKAVWYPVEEGGSWVSFNPVPHSDEYQAQKITIPPLGTNVINPENQERYLILLEGDVVVKNQDNITQSIDAYSETFVITISVNSQITLTTDSGATLGIFSKQNVLQD